MATKEEELWVGFARDAMSSYAKPDDIEDAEDLVDDMSAVACDYADAMCDEFEERFSSSGRRKAGKKRSRKGTEEEP